jgi:single-stranded DNA-binding protein
MILAQVLGNLGRDAEVKRIGDKEYISFSVASTEKQGEQENTTWVSVLSSNNPNLLPFLKRGQQVFVSGKMKASIYQSQNNIGMDISLFAQTLQLCGAKREEQTPPSSGSLGVQPKQPTFSSVAEPQQPSSPPPPAEENKDDLPF